jgi:hypothetical protein
MDSLLESIHGILNAEDGQITIRHLFYRLVGLRVIEKSEQAYRVLGSHLSKWRRSGDVAWDSFADSTRWHIQDATFDSVADALENTVNTYRRNLWGTQRIYLEIWVEKDACAGIIAPTANSFGVPVFVARGFASLSSLYNAANTFRAATDAGKTAIIYHCGDFDPSGIAAGESMVKAFRDDFKVDVQFKRIAVTKEQIRRLKLPTRPVKRSDTRAAKWTGGECVELDTMPPSEIRDLVRQSIVQHINEHEWQTLKKTEELERETLRGMWLSV